MLNGRIGFRIIEITEDENNFIGRIELLNDINLKVNDEEKSQIHISLVGVFIGDKSFESKEFEKMLKLNGATALSHSMRAYIQSVTALSNIPPVIMPMINFVDFFKERENEDM